MPVEPETLRTVMGRFTTGVAVVTAVRDGEPVGMTANAVASVSLEPPLVLFCAIRTSNTLQAVKGSAAFALNVLHDGQEDLARRFAARGRKSFDGVSYALGRGGAPLLKDCVAWLDCTLWAVYDGGDHEILLGHVEAAETASERPPLLFYRSGYHSMTP